MPDPAAACRIQIIGAGDIGRRTFEALTQTNNARVVQLVGRDPEKTVRAANLARFASLQRGYSTTIGHAVTDLFDVDRTAEQIAAFQPDLIFLAASMQAWWVITTLPPRAFRSLYAANFGPWLPVHLAPVLRAMEAVRRAGSTAIVVNAAYPDAVHPVLAAKSLAPDLGIGNVANNVPALRVAAAAQLGLPAAHVDVRLTAHHYVSHRLSRTGESGRAAFDLRVLVDADEVTDQLDLPQLFSGLTERFRRTGGLAGQAMTAASALSVLEPLADNRPALVHAPGPLGLVGGYPVALDAGKVALALAPGVTEQDASRVNLSGQLQDGISEIRPDGTVVFEPGSMQVLTDELGYRCDTMTPNDAEGRAVELVERLARYRARASVG